MRLIGYIIVLLLVIADLAIIFNFTLPQISKFSNAYQNSKLKENQLNLLIELEKKVTEMNLNAQKLKAYQLKAEKIIPTEYRPEEYIVLILNLLQQTPLKLNSFSFNPTQGGVSISFSLTGNYFAIEDFLKLVQNSRRLLEVNNFSISGSGERLNLNLSAFSPTLK